MSTRSWVTRMTEAETLSIGHHVARWLEDRAEDDAALRLLPWQRQLLPDLFAMVPDDTPTGLAFEHRRAFVDVPHRNGLRVCG